MLDGPTVRVAISCTYKVSAAERGTAIIMNIRQRFILQVKTKNNFDTDIYD